MPAPTYPLAPHHSQHPTNVRKAYIQNLTDLLHECLLSGDTHRARRAWSILIRCREVDWRSRWQWGLRILEVSADTESQIPSTFQSELYSGKEAEKWLRGVRISAREAEKPSLLHALVLHLIKHKRYRAALDELDTFLTSYPYLLSGPLHTYAGLLAFYLAQPVSKRISEGEGQSHTDRGGRAPSTHSSRPSSPSSATSRSTIRKHRPHEPVEPVNPILLRQARAFFSKALTLDSSDAVATEFIGLVSREKKLGVHGLTVQIDHPERGSVSGSEADLSRRSDTHSLGDKSDDDGKADEDDHDFEAESDVENDHERKDDDKVDDDTTHSDITEMDIADSDVESNFGRLLDGHQNV